MTRLVCFDLDGTLADTLADLAGAVNFALNENGFDGYEVERYKDFVGNGLDNLIHTTIKEPHSQAVFEAVKAGFNRYYADHFLDFTCAYDGMDQVLRSLSDRDVITAVLSNKPDRFVVPIMETLYPQHHFSLCYGQRDLIPRKPAPDALILALKELGVEKEDAVYIGDSDVDVKFARAAGVSFIGAKWGFRTEKELRSAGAEVMADQPSDLIPLLLKE